MNTLVALINAAPQYLVAIAAIISAITVIVIPVVQWVRMEYAVKHLKEKVTTLDSTVTSIDAKVDKLMLDAATWFTPIAIRRRRAAPAAGRGKRIA